MTPFRQQPTELRPDIEGGVAHDDNAAVSSHYLRSLNRLACSMPPSGRIDRTYAMRIATGELGGLLTSLGTNAS